MCWQNIHIPIEHERESHISKTEYTVLFGQENNHNPNHGCNRPDSKLAEDGQDLRPQGGENVQKSWTVNIIRSIKVDYTVHNHTFSPFALYISDTSD